MARLISRQDPIHGRFRAPASKPETQRALIMAALADGLTKISYPLVARETLVMIEACRSLGAKIAQHEDRLEVSGTGPVCGQELAASGPAGDRYVWASGSALVARLFLTLASALPENVIVDGNCTLRVRPFRPLIEALSQKGVEFRFFDKAGHLPVTAVSRSLPGGRYQLGTDVSSQFATALAISAPLADTPLLLELTGPEYSISYIRQTVDMMARFGVAVDATDDMRRILVPNQRCYQAVDVEITGDYTSASYIVGAAFVTGGSITVSNLDPASLQGERAILDIVADLGGEVSWTAEQNTVHVDCTRLTAPVDAVFDLRDCPNILPTVAAMAATVPGRVRIMGGRLTQNHKSPRISAIAAELSKAGVAVETTRDDSGDLDGLVINGGTHLAGGVEFSDHGDHRIYMALCLFSLACQTACSFSGAPDTHDSFPGFQELLVPQAAMAQTADTHHSPL